MTIGNDRVLWVTGAGSGMGRASAVSAARQGYRVALTGRRADALAETGRLVRQAGGQSLELPADVSRDQDVEAAHAKIVADWGTVTDVVLAAGLNTPQRQWRDQSLATFQQIVETNFVAVARVVAAVLPGMRERHGGSIVVVSSYSSWQFQPGAGVAYSASKTALGALTRTLNSQEKPYGIRACHLCPGDVDTDFLQLRPSVPDPRERRVMLSPDDVGRAVQFVLDGPAHVCIDELVISPTSQI